MTNIYRVYEELDADLMRQICALMKSPSVIVGYTTLLDIGGVAYDYSETDNELLAKVVANRNKITDAVRKQSAEYNSWRDKYGNTAPESESVERLKISVANAKPCALSAIVYNLRRAGASLRTKKDAQNVISIVNYCIEELSNLSNTFKVDNDRFYFESGEDFIKTVSEQLNVGYSLTLHLRISKTVERHEKKIPPAPPAPVFTLREVEDVLDILEQLNRIVSLKG